MPQGPPVAGNGKEPEHGGLIPVAALVGGAARRR
jgi:hypothetical protein